MNSKERVTRAITMTGPDRIPLLFFNRDRDRSDILSAAYAEAADYPNKGTTVSEWGFVWERLDDTLGQPKQHPIRSWKDFEGYTPPDPDARGRFDNIKEWVVQNNDTYIIGSLNISGFNQVTFIRGFEDTLQDLYMEPERIGRLIDMVFSFENRIIRGYATCGVNAIGFADDWGTQASLMIDPQLWRDVFKPRYREQFDLAHSLGLHVYFHSCGQVHEIIPDLIEIGADVLNLNQPDIFGIEKLRNEFGGKVCFNCPVDHQKVAIGGSRRDVFDYVKRLIDNLGAYNGGLIGYIEEYRSMGMTEKEYCTIVEAFTTLGK